MDDASRRRHFPVGACLRCLNELVGISRDHAASNCACYMVSQYPDSKYVVRVDGCANFASFWILSSWGRASLSSNTSASIDRASELCPDMLHLVDPSQWSRVEDCCHCSGPQRVDAAAEQGEADQGRMMIDILLDRLAFKADRRDCVATPITGVTTALQRCRGAGYKCFRGPKMTFCTAIRPARPRSMRTRSSGSPATVRH